ncbi:extensin-3-like [Cucumis melo var. makuwa]|uniref:Extensin-3-like n=1 Tax=Cucumis melo var. makuwa TaxID=1194695 RepID=A0A5A7UXN4_CUCMM|nr:extensin-3-like [Cucumis melo var. makuwa]
MPLLSSNLPSNFATHYIPPSLLSPPSMPPTTKPIVPYHPFIIPPPFKKTSKHTWSPSSRPQKELGRPIVPYYPYKFLPPPYRKHAHPPPGYHVFPPRTLPQQAKKLHMSGARQAAPAPPPETLVANKSAVATFLCSTHRSVADRLVSLPIAPSVRLPPLLLQSFVNHRSHSSFATSSCQTATVDELSAAAVVECQTKPLGRSASIRLSRAFSEPFPAEFSFESCVCMPIASPSCPSRVQPKPSLLFCGTRAACLPHASRFQPQPEPISVFQAILNRQAYFLSFPPILTSFILGVPLGSSKTRDVPTELQIAHVRECASLEAEVEVREEASWRMTRSDCGVP